jgi:hypothetical protein
VKVIVLFFVALALGAIGTLVAINTLNRNTPWNKATMTVIAHQMKQMDDSLKANRCTGNDFVPRLQILRAVANDIEPAFAEDIKDPQFNRYAADLRAAADGALAAPPANCKVASATMSSLGKACDSCHRDFR